MARACFAYVKKIKERYKSSSIILKYYKTTSTIKFFQQKINLINLWLVLLLFLLQEKICKPWIFRRWKEFFLKWCYELQENKQIYMYRHVQTLTIKGYLRVLRVSSMWWWEGLMVAIIAVLEFPPKLSFKSLKTNRTFLKILVNATFQSTGWYFHNMMNCSM